MEEYRLIKKYPSLPKNWEEGMIVGRGDRGYYSFFTPQHSKYEEFKDELWLGEIKRGLGEFWEEAINNNPLGLEVGKEYWLEYLGCKSTPQKVKITKITSGGYPWKVSESGNGILSPKYWKKLSEDEIFNNLNVLSINDILNTLLVYPPTSPEFVETLKLIVEYKLEENEKVK